MTDDERSRRFQWEQILRRARVDKIIPAKGKRGAVSGTAFKAVAYTWASYGGPGGTDIYPGIATVAVGAEVGYKTAKLVTAKLVELGLLRLVAPSRRRRGHFDEYELAIPADLFDLLEILSPDQVKEAAAAMRESYRGKPTEGGPVDPPPNCPERAPQGDRDETGVGSNLPPNTARVGSSGPAVGGPVDCGTNHETKPSLLTKPSAENGFRTAVTLTRARGSAKDRNFDDEDGARGLSAPLRGPIRRQSGCGYPACRSGIWKLGRTEKLCPRCHPDAKPEGATA